ncbi:uncharacterized protein LOC142635726 [Castanea sativa]|uniref:uncharacterized protein LOC142635726 n=1 Tax=Castanea sativa TaxID=21020 RepID=UPI003F650084
MIVGGTTTSGSSKKARKNCLKMVQNIQLMGFVPKMARIDNPITEFSKEDARRLHYPHDDALIVSIQVGYYNTHRVLIDNESSADILYYLVFQQMRIDRERLVLTNAPLVGFGRTKVYPLSTITLPVIVADYPQQIIKDVTFLVMACSSAYNANLGWPTLNSWKAVTSTYHLMIKFPTDYGVREFSRIQVAAHECYIAMLEMDNHLQTMNIEEQRAMAEPMEGLEEMTLDNSRPKWTTRIGTLTNPLVHQALASFLRENQDVFALSHEDIPRIDPLVIVHRLNVSATFPPVRQKKQVFSQKRDRTIAKEVRKLQDLDFIREVYYPDWLANVVMVKKANEKWTMCVDFTDLNKACPKDSYPLS